MDQKLIVFFAQGIIQLAVVVRVLLRPHREPASRVAWVAAIALVPVAGIIACLLHAKSFTQDREITLIGSANLDPRRFGLNYENNVLICDAKVTAIVRARQNQYLSQTTAVLPEAVAAWSLPRRLWNNTLATLGPLL